MRVCHCLSIVLHLPLSHPFTYSFQKNVAKYYYGIVFNSFSTFYCCSWSGYDWRRRLCHHISCLLTLSFKIKYLCTLHYISTNINKVKCCHTWKSTRQQRKYTHFSSVISPNAFDWLHQMREKKNRCDIRYILWLAQKMDFYFCCRWMQNDFIDFHNNNNNNKMLKWISMQNYHFVHSSADCKWCAHIEL